MLIINGHRVEPAEPGLIFDDGFTFGRGAFETLPVYIRPLWLDRHLDRLNRTLVQLGIARVVAAEDILTQIARENIHGEALKIIATAQDLVLVTRPLPTPDPDHLTLMVSANVHPSNSPLAGMKTLNYLGYQLAREQAIKAGYSDALLLSPSGNVLETAVANIFTISNGRIQTPVANGCLLPGIVRQYVVENFAVDEGTMALEAVLSADEVFVTNSLIGIRSILKIGDHQLPARRPSDTLAAIQAGYDRAVRAASVDGKAEVIQHRV